MRYQPAHAAKSGSVPFMLRGPKSVRTVLSAAVAGVIGLVPTVLVSSPAMAAVVAGDYSIADASGPEAGLVTFTITREHPTGTDTLGEETLTWTTSDGVAKAGEDYTAVTGATTGSITFPAYTNTTVDQTRTISVQTLNDSTDEADDEDFTVTLAKPGGSPITLTDGSAKGTIVDDDNPTFTLAASPNPVNESLSDPLERQATITATLSKTSTYPIAIPVLTSDDTAKAGQDYTAVDTVINISAGQQSGSIKVPVLDDSVDEPTQSFKVTTTAGTNVAGTQTATVNIADDDAAPVIKIASAGTVTEGGKLTFAATLVGTSENTVTAKWDTANGPVVADPTHGIAKAGEDYTAVTGGTVTFAPNASTPTTPIQVQTTADNIDEITEDLQVKLSDPSNGTLFTTSAATGSITDSGTTPGPQVTLAPVEITEGAATTSRARTFKVTLSKASGRDQKVGYAVANGTPGGGYGQAEGGEDFASTTGTLTFAAGETEKTFTVDVIGDNIDEGDGENMAITLTDAGTPTGLASGLSLGTTQVKITDDDAKPVISLNRSDITMPEGDGPSAVLFEIKLSNPSSQSIGWTATRAVGAQAGTAAEVGDAGSAPGDDDYEELTDLTGTFTAGQTSQYVLFVVNGDEVFEPAETIRYSFARSGGNADQATGGPLNAQVTLTNDDDAPQVEVTSAEANEGDTLTLNGIVTGVAQGDTPLSFTLAGKSMGGEAAASPNDFSPSTFQRTLPAGTPTGTNWQIGVVTIADDSAGEPAETILVNGVGFGNTGSVTDGVITIAESDGGAPEPDPVSVTLVGPSFRNGPGSIWLSGTTAANTDVQLWSAPYNGGDDDWSQDGATVKSSASGAFVFNPWLSTTGRKYVVHAGDAMSDELQVELRLVPTLIASSTSKGVAYLKVGGGIPHGKFLIQRQNANGKWDTVFTSNLMSTGTYNKTLKGQPSGKALTYRAYIYGSTANGVHAGVSPARRITIR
jgi:hypothetical protein